MARPRLNRKIVRTSVSLDEEMYADVYALAEQNDVSVAWLIRKAVAELLDRRSDELTHQLPLFVPGAESERKTR